MNKETSRKDQQEHQRQQDYGTSASGLRSNITTNNSRRSSHYPILNSNFKGLMPFQVGLNVQCGGVWESLVL
nr:hypothetical protein [Tanacetum cinerariifolium]